MSICRKLFSGLFALATLTMPAQNLVVNGNFDVPKGRLKRMGSIDMARGWTSPTPNRADLFSARIEEAPMSAPKNMYGTQDPKTGEHYAGIRTYSQHGRDARSYMQTQLSEPLTQGQKYCVKYHISLADLSKFANGGVSAFLSKVSVEKDEAVDLGFDAKVPSNPARVVNTITEWQGVCGVYEAEGDEQYLIIGNFQANDKVVTEKIRRPKGEVRSQLQYAYYYIDDVSVTPIRHARECACEAGEKVRGEFIFGRSGFADSDLSATAKIDRQVFYFKRFQHNIDFSMEPWIKEMAELLKAEPAVNVSLTGHIDEMEKDRAETRTDLERLGMDRASSVKEALVKHGVDARRINVHDGNAEAMADKTGTEVGMSKNRRVEVELVK